MVYIIPAICTGIMMVLYFPLTPGKEAILELMDGALKETIMIDYHRRSNIEAKSMNKPLNRKVKKIEIASEKGVETIEFKDSIEEYLANQLATQYVLATIHPLIPNDFNAIFKEELNKKGISCPTGIIYQHNEKKQYSGQDSTTFRKAILTQPVTLDIKNTIQIQTWADCDWITILRHTNMKALGYVIFFFIASAFVLFYKRKQKENPENTTTNILKEESLELVPSSPDDMKIDDTRLKIDIYDKVCVTTNPNNMRIDDVKLKIYINGKECVTTKMEFFLLSLLVREPDHTATREQIIQTLWPKETETTDKALLNNRIDGHINSLRKTLSEFPGYQIITITGKGYRLEVPQNSN